MTVRVDLLRKAIEFSRQNPDLYDQSIFFIRGTNTACIIGRAADMSLGHDGFSMPIGYRDHFVFAKDFLGLAYPDVTYIYSGVRTLDEIEQRVNEIAAREEITTRRTAAWNEVHARIDADPEEQAILDAERARSARYDAELDDKITLRVGTGDLIEIAANNFEGFVIGARAVDPDVIIRRVKTIEEII